MCFGVQKERRVFMQADARRTAGSRQSGGQGPQHTFGLQGGPRGHRWVGEVGRVGYILQGVDCPAAAAVDADARWDEVSLFSGQPRFRRRGQAGLRRRAIVYCVCTLAMEVSAVRMLVSSHTPHSLLSGRELASRIMDDGWTLESHFFERRPRQGQCSIGPLPGPCCCGSWTV